MTSRTSEELLIDLIPRLAKFSRDDRFRVEREKALLTYWNVFRDISSEVAMEGDNETRFMEWFLFDYLTRSGKFLWQLFRDEEDLRPDEERALGLIESSRLGVYQICGVDAKGGTFEIEDLLTKDVYVIRDSVLSSRLAPDEILFGRVLALGGASLLTGAPMLLPAGVGKPLLDFLDRSYRRYTLTIKRVSRAEFLKTEGFLVNHFLAEYEAGLAGEQEARLFHMVYSVDRSPAVTRLLESHDEFERDPSSESKWLWWDASGETRGWLSLDEDALSFYATTQQDFAEGQRRLEALMGKQLSKGEDLTEKGDEIELLETPGVRRIAAGEETGAADAATDEEFVARYVEEYYERWLDTPIPDLESRTPREVSRSPSGRARIEALLRKMEELQFQRALDSNLTYDFDRLRRKLGLIPSGEPRH